MEGKDQIIQLGKVLREEQERGCDDGAVPGGIERFLTSWRMQANGALQHAPVQQTLELLAGYGVFDEPTRRARIGIALEQLRELFRGHSRTENQEPRTENRSSAAQNSKPRTQNSKLAPAAPITLDTSLDQLSGIGKVTAQSFRRLGVRTVRDLLYHFPHRYDDYTSQKKIADLQIGAVETVVATISDLRTFSMRSGGQALEVLVGDESGSLKVVFFRQPWLARQLQIGAKIVLSGKVDSYQGLRQMSSPDWEPYSDDELIHTGRLVPVHPLTKGLYERSARTLIKRVVDHAAPLMVDYLPEVVRERAGLMPLAQAIVQMHFPVDQEQLARARLRLGFDEFLCIQLGVLQRKVLWQGERGYA
ncbi:MAG TPA: OB-fold nucleic acid binding domain-containing protein, partial [Roseiflexaceae bacterium]|nr:OB-fold nucleic acid binding domain-containing protein [Roseiflexaceae bacterium]